MLRSYVISLIAIAAVTTPGRSQGVESAFLVGYGVLSIGAIASLSSRGNPPTVETGTRLRMRLRGTSDWSNDVRVARLTNDSMVVANDSGSWSIGRSEIDSLQVKASTGRWAEGWLIGLVAGGATGAILAHEAVDANQGDEWFTPGQAAVIGGVFLGGSASIVGAGIGLLAPSRWVTIGNPKGARVSIAPTLVRPGFVAQLRF
jgi:hypothetical protein